MKIGFLGLGNMGLNVVRNLTEHDHEVLAWNRSEEPRLEAEKDGIKTFATVRELVTALDADSTHSASAEKNKQKEGDGKQESKDGEQGVDGTEKKERKIIFSMVSAGDPVDMVLFKNDDALFNLLCDGDVFIDCANSFYKESIKRGGKLAKKGIKMLDAGISGGVDGARHGACAMVGGDEEAFHYVEQVFKDMTVKNGYGYFGELGAGHFVKMVHNAIEYGMMQAIAEGLNLIDKSKFNPDIHKLLEVWNNGSIIESRLIGFLESSLKKNDLEKLETEVGGLGTGMWASREALEHGVPFNSISNAVFNRYSSRGVNEFAYKIIQAMRAEFGSHTGKDREHG